MLWKKIFDIQTNFYEITKILSYPFFTEILGKRMRIGAMSNKMQQRFVVMFFLY